jgi:hypothetical protein
VCSSDLVAKATIDGIPIAEVCGQTTPSTTVFGNVLEGLEKKEVVNLNIAAWLRKQMLNTVNMFLSPFHDGG